jgi:hypothetical protein
MYTPAFKVSRNRVPILSKDDIDAIGERFAADFCPDALRTPMEIDVDRFVTRYLGMQQDYQYLSHCSMYLGMTVFNDTDRVTVYNPVLNQAEYISARAGTVIIDNALLDEKQEHRYRYTMGHEAGHGVLHACYFGYNPVKTSLFGANCEPLVKCRVDGASVSHKPYGTWTDSDRMEWQANKFASALLMPVSMVKRVAKTAELRSSSVNAALERTAAVFNVSYEAAHYRLQELGLIKKRVPVR